MSASFVSTSGILPRDEFPQFNTWPSARWDKPGGPFAPHTGTQYVYSQIADVSYKRLTREIAVPAGGGDLTFWTSYDTEPDWDYMFVEARTPGGDNWTTLPDANGNTSQSTGPRRRRRRSGELPGRVGRPAPAAHPLPDRDGRRPRLHADRHDRRVERGLGQLRRLAAVADQPGRLRGRDGRDLDRLRQRLGGPEPRRVPRRRRRCRTARARRSRPTSAAGRPGQPDTSGTNANNWIRTDASGFPVGATISTPDSLLFGFGFEGISTQSSRNAVMGRSLRFLLD